MTRFVRILLLIAAVSARSTQSQPHGVDIFQPSGPFAVGRVSYDWIDPARPEILSNVPHTPREILVDVWYPAATAIPGASTAPYLPNAAHVNKSPFVQAERNNWGDLWLMIVAGDVHTHAYENAPVAPGNTRFPLIILSHGFSGEPYAYTHQIQELVSHGYVVATIHHTYEVTVAVFPDGRMVPFSEENARGTEAPSVDEMLKWAEPRIDTWAADIRFTLDQITRLNAAPAKKSPFAGRIDLGRVGVFGHSFGGVAAARACELEPRIKACLNQDGMLGGPSVHFEGGHPPAQPYMFLSSPLPGPPTDEMLKSMGMTRKQFEQDNAQAEAMIDKEFQECFGGAYQVDVQISGFRHNGFTDIPLLNAAGNPEKTARALGSLRLVESYTVAFFNKFLNGAHDTLLDREPAPNSEVQIKRYPR
jgi:dienelactone hydrolase